MSAVSTCDPSRLSGNCLPVSSGVISGSSSCSRISLPYGSLVFELWIEDFAPILGHHADFRGSESYFVETRLGEQCAMLRKAGRSFQRVVPPRSLDRFQGHDLPLEMHRRNG